MSDATGTTDWGYGEGYNFGELLPARLYGYAFWDVIEDGKFEWGGCPAADGLYTDGAETACFGGRGIEEGIPGVSVGVALGARVRVAVGVTVGPGVRVGVTVAVGVGVGVGPGVRVAVGVALGPGVLVGVGVMVDVLPLVGDTVG